MTYDNEAIVRYAYHTAEGNVLDVAGFRKGSQPEAIFERLKALGQSSHFSVHLKTGNDVVEQIV